MGEFQILTLIKKKRELLDPYEEALNFVLGSRRWIVENVIARVKNFKCLSTRWRHSLGLHHVVFFLICNIVNIDMQFRPIRK